ncbi:GNAT family N-acetyltransferase [Persicobacter diffluens]|uniref:N-acetyltransferase domain-containing protein n=1 Tax=Persicobacter diffluens TaxID=981 RepID=A0AAN5AK15_9BACT|nr:hypothetical protein PEDI_05630 [Persicobacter diffluens]
MKIIKVREGNKGIYLHLCQAYEAEFSALTEKLPDESGLFALDTPLTKPFLGLLWYQDQDQVPVGFANIRLGKEYNKVCEFYVIPAVRKKGLGKALAFEIFQSFPGKWDVRQLQAAKQAQQFWRATIGAFTGNNFQESQLNDPDWGEVICQRFQS